MAAVGFTPIQLYRTATAAAAPSAGNLADGELAINTNDGRLFYKDSGGAVQTIAWRIVPISAGGTGATTASGALTALGAVAKAGDTMTGVLAVTAGTVSAPGLAFSGDTNTGIYSPAADTIAFTEGGVEAMRLDAIGNVGIGTTSPTARLNIFANTTSDALRITQTGTGNALVVEDSANPDATPFVVDTNGRLLSGATASYAGIFGNPGNLQISSTSLHGIQSGRFANDAFGSDVQLVKSRSTTIGAQGVVQNGDSLGNVLFGGSDGTAFLAGAIINAAVDGTPGTNDMPGRLVFSTTADGAANPTERMRINNAGNVGIGITAPGFRLDVRDAANTCVHVMANTSGVRVGMSVDTPSASAGYVGTYSNNALTLGTNNAERMRIEASGNVGIGTSAPVNRLQVNGSFGRGAPVTKTGNFTLADTENWLICNGAGSITVTFPAASAWTGREVMIKTIAAQTVVSASSNVVPINSATAGTAVLPATAGAWATLVSDGTNWVIMQS